MRLPSSFNSGAFRFALMIASLFAVGSVLLLFVVERSIRSYAEEATALGLRSETAVLAGELPDGGPSELIDTIKHRQSSKIEQPFRYLLTDSRGTRLAGDLPLNAARAGWSSVQFLDDHSPPGEESSPETLETLGTRLPDGSLLIVATDTYDIQKLRRRVDGFTIWSGVGITLVALIGGYLIGGLFLRRLEKVNRSVARIMDGKLTERLPPIGMAPELDHLSNNLNLMLDRIGGLMDGLRQVSTDIAHDLRTPLTRLRQQLEDMQEGCSIDTYQRGIDAALTQIDDILGIFRALMRIGMIEGGAAGTQLHSIDLSEIADRIAQIYRPVAEDDFKKIEMHIEPGVEVMGDGELLAQVFANLFDNAMKHTPTGTKITVTVKRIHGAPVAIIADDGPGIPAAEREKVLRRFYRLDTSRSTPGAGLGLALVEAIAKLHHAQLHIETSKPGLFVQLTFPTSVTRVSADFTLQVNE